MIAVRRAVPADAAAIAAVTVESWRAAYAGIVPPSVLDAMSVDDARIARWTATVRDDAVAVVVAADGERVVGFARTGASRDDDASDGVGELHVLYLLADVWGTGLGGEVHDAATAWLAERYDEATLWVFEDNSRARRFYQRRGWRPDGLRHVFEMAGESIPEVRYRRRLR